MTWEDLTEVPRLYCEGFHVYMDIMMQEAVTVEIHGRYCALNGGMHPQIFEVLGSPSKAIGYPRDLRKGINTYECHIVDEHCESLLAALVVATTRPCGNTATKDHPKSTRIQKRHTRGGRGCITYTQVTALRVICCANAPGVCIGI